MQVATWAGGLNSTALLIGLVEKGIAVDLAVYPDTGSDMPETLDYFETVREWYKERTDRKLIHLKPDVPFEEFLLTNKEMPSMAYGFKACAVRWRRDPVSNFLREKSNRANQTWNQGRPVTRFMAVDYGNQRRAGLTSDSSFNFVYPLIEWGWSEEDCIKTIEKSGLPLPPVRPRCFFCPSSKKCEILDLQKDHPELLEKALDIEERSRQTDHSMVIIKEKTHGLGRIFGWSEFLEADEQKQRDYPESDDAPCSCWDGDIG